MFTILVSSVDDFLTEHNIYNNPNDNGQQYHEDCRSTLILSARKHRPDCEHLTIDEDSSNNLNTCLQSLKHELETELHMQHISIKASYWNNANYNKLGT